MSWYFTRFNKGFIDFYSNIQINFESRNIGKTKIGCSLGPDQCNEATLEKLIQNGMSTILLDFRNPDWDIDKARECVEIIRKYILNLSVKEKFYFPIPIAIWLKGTDIISGHFLNEEEVTVRAGDMVTLTTSNEFRDGTYYPLIYINYPTLHQKLRRGSTIVFDYGALILLVASGVQDEEIGILIKCIALNSAILHDNALVYLSNEEDQSKGSLLYEDQKIIEFCFEIKIDAIFIPLRHEVTMRHIKDFMLKMNIYQPLLVACIYDSMAMNHMDKILKEVDGICLNRKMAAKCAVDNRIHIMEKIIVAKCIKAAKFFIVNNPLPEQYLFYEQSISVLSLANLVLSGVDGILVDNELVNDPQNHKMLKTISQTIQVAEGANWQNCIFEDITRHDLFPLELYFALSITAITLCLNVSAKAIFVLTVTGKTAYSLYKYRPPIEVFAITRSSTVAKQFSYYRGITPIYFQKPGLDNWCEDVDSRFRSAINWAKKMKRVEIGDIIILMSGWLPGPGNTNRMRMIIVS